MYSKVKTYKVAHLDNPHETAVTPIYSLEDEYGGVSHIIEDDHCYVLINKVDKHYRMSYYWYPEAAEALSLILLQKGKA